jgi:hypothetical protein
LKALSRILEKITRINNNNKIEISFELHKT